MNSTKKRSSTTVLEIFSAILICMLCSCQLNYATILELSRELTQSYQRVLPTVVLIEGDVMGDYTSEIRGIGTGFFVSKEYVLTVAHVANHLVDDTIQLVLWNGQKIGAKKVAIDEFNDLALLKIDFNDVKFYKMPKLNLETDPQIGEVVFLIGSPFLFRGTMSAGILSRRTTIIDFPDSPWECEIYLVDAPCEGGHSGSPVFDAKLGIVGILTGYCGKFTVVIPSYSVCCFLRANGVTL